ncbi:UvrD/REP helicase [Thermanaerovibrio acidaminovorans DSM 6589]|uniref:DNA 3'-5' helicase n=1 Tax=Thermanaerovibrio acidaminovorans (strain ATCC 49978 / DSM 6589 / Su883) TaxID=525903 RepID=D1B9M8_THEAS|nr:UvrD-helicase domain-containing protein [Thermanaerovibrio acidaminovorans]ACZ18981.1 UvrD/REP helicase [Thermanaerovibrio acidaminovorans DSM 6589]
MASPKGFNVLDGLNPKQVEAVTYCDGNQLILAGAGSGKTRVLTRKIAYLISHKGVSPSKILAVTFTNKAAGEMRQRVERLLGGSLHGIRICTFHSYGLNFLRRNEEIMRRMGYATPLVVIDRSDQKRLLKLLLKENNVDERRVDPSWLMEAFSAAKGEGNGSAYFRGEAQRLFEAYEAKMRSQGALDFDDLIHLPLKILSTHREALERELDSIEWVLVDEYQDVNRSQYMLLKRLSSRGQRTVVVGDPDQAIYGWRGADVSMILNFDKDFQGAKVTVLEQNYRSTGHILEGANCVIARNSDRPKKNLWTAASRGEKIRILKARNDEEDSRCLVDWILELQGEGYALKDMAILYRVNALSRLYEQRLIEAGIPYRVIRGLGFYDRKEIKDVLALMRLAIQPRDLVSFERMVNVPQRGIGAKSTEALWAWMGQLEAQDPGEFWRSVLEGDAPLKGRAREGIRALARGMLGILSLRGNIRLAVRYILEEYGYGEHLEREDQSTFEERLQNVEELMSVLPEGSIDDVLSEVALFSDADVASGDDRVSLLTLHAAKGLEFPVVFMVGLEEGIFPNAKCREDRSLLEEERRLFYVGMTRAQERLFLSGAARRVLFGSFMMNPFSRFLSEIPSSCVVEDDRTKEVSGVVYGGANRRRWSW